MNSFSEYSLPDFNNTELAFKARTDAQLKQALRLFQMIDSPLLANIGPKLMIYSFEIGLPIENIVKKTLFQQFCGGTSIENTVPASEAMYKYKVKTILDYSVEGEKNETGFDETCREIIATLVHGGKTESVAFTACKITGLASFDLLAKIQANVQLTPVEVMAWEKVKERVEAICNASVENNTPVFIDAEESWIQETIDALAESMMEKYNTTKPLIYTTVQLYRHDRLNYLKELIRRSENRKYFLGVKLVRGAYMEKEAERAASFSTRNPIQKSKEDTDRDYDFALELCMEHLHHVAICAGTHNENSSIKLAEMMREKSIPKNHPHILFAQLYGMSDHISFNLSHHGFNVAKYLPYGPVKAVMPYLMRRAQENTSISGQSGRELTLLKKENRRRKKV
ncbi:MAG: proline dehydrogenase family protein [Bacteroidia bacterium]|nr:proline dehydrogenase family protein [Bacteroidia bacterium]